MRVNKVVAKQIQIRSRLVIWILTVMQILVELMPAQHVSTKQKEAQSHVVLPGDSIVD